LACTVRGACYTTPQRSFDKQAAWAKQGIIDRAVLIDFSCYTARRNIIYDPLDHYTIPLLTLEQIAKKSEITFYPGDVLLRTGLTAAVSRASLPTKRIIPAYSAFQYPGLESDLSVLAFLWDFQFAAVAGDCRDFKGWPPPEQAIHQILLNSFGMPIGERFDLEELIRGCIKQVRWKFLFTSQALNGKGNVASPLIAIALF
jgi:hypothetical protein